MYATCIQDWRFDNLIMTLERVIVDKRIFANLYFYRLAKFGASKFHKIFKLFCNRSKFRMHETGLPGLGPNL